MSKNKNRPQVSEQGPQTEVDLDALPKPLTESVKPKQDKKEGAEYLITSQSKVQFDTPITELYNGDVSEWIEKNTKRYISFIAKL